MKKARRRVTPSPRCDDWHRNYGITKNNYKLQTQKKKKKKKKKKRLYFYILFFSIAVLLYCCIACAFCCSLVSICLRVFKRSE